MKRLAAPMAKIAAPILGRRGLGEAQLVMQWESIVGSGLARDTLPVKLSFPKAGRTDGVLHIKTANGIAPVLAHMAPQILERVNGFFGYRAVERLAFQQGPLPRPQESRPPPVAPLDSADEARLAARLDEVADPALRASLERLGRSVLGAETAARQRDRTR